MEERKDSTRTSSTRTRSSGSKNNGENSLPVIEFSGRTYIQKSFEGCAMICDEIIQRIEKLNESVVPIGFDIEWTVVYSQGQTRVTDKTALVQLCITPMTCHLFHFYNLTKLPAAFVLLLSHPKVKLVGVNVTQDVRKLGRDFSKFPAQQIVENNCVECGKLMNDITGSKERWSLARLSARTLKGTLEKKNSVRKGGWHKFPLNPAQIKYAATDAYVSLLIYLRLKSGVAD